jgi:hypothetical protein
VPARPRAPPRAAASPLAATGASPPRAPHLPSCRSLPPLAPLPRGPSRRDPATPRAACRRRLVRRLSAGLRAARLGRSAGRGYGLRAAQRHVHAGSGLGGRKGEETGAADWEVPKRRGAGGGLGGPEDGNGNGGGGGVIGGGGREWVRAGG